MKQIMIIGAGAAGLMTAATILETEENDGEYHIHLFEKNMSPGKKVIISGGGRCNVTTSIEDKKILSTKYIRGWEFIRKAIGKFNPRKCREWFESHGVPLKIQEDLRVFPVSDDGRDIVGVFESIFAKNREKISLHYGEGVDMVSLFQPSGTEGRIHDYEKEAMNSHPQGVYGLSLYSEGRVQEGNSKRFLLTTSNGNYEADILVITTGGNAYSHTGSSGDGYAFARTFGHTVTSLGPSLSSFLTRETWLHELSGLAFEDAKIFLSLSSLRSEDPSFESGRLDPSQELRNKKQELTGPLLLTHFGISGPLAFMTSSHLAWENIGKGQEKMIHFSPLTSMGFAEWEIFLKDQFHNHPKKLITGILSEKLPRRFSEAFVKKYFPHIEVTFAGSIARIDRDKISDLLGNGIPLTLLERRPGDEFVTAGGVSTDELDPETMESRKHKNLYFAGEILNVDGYTGGFSLQICWSSGYAAGKEISKRINGINN